MTDHPVSVRTRTEQQSGIVFVSCLIDNDTSEPRGVRLEPQLNGPTLPPRRQGLPIDGWTDGTYTTVVGPFATESVGYACVTDEPADPAVVVTAPAQVGEP